METDAAPNAEAHSPALPALGIIAGGGPLPGRVATAARAAGRHVFILGIEGAADPAVPGTLAP